MPAPRLELRQSQRLALTPGVRLGLTVLALPASDLAELIAAEAAENPLLRIEPPATGASAFDIAARTVPEEEGLARHLARQLAEMGLEPEVEALARYLAGDLDERGYLPETDAEIAEAHGLPPDRVAAAVAALRSCEPPGIGARDLTDCLALQLRAQGLSAAETRAALPLLEPLGQIGAARLRRRHPAQAALIDRLAALRPRLAPHPAAKAGPAGAPPAPPDLRVTLGPGGMPEAELLDPGLPRLSLDRALLAGGRWQAGRRAAAERLISAVAFRGRTLLRVGQEIVSRQAAWFLDAEPAPRSLSRQEVAAALGLHPATVGRAVRGRRLEYRGRSYPLAHFLAGPAGRGPDAPSRPAAEARLAALIAAEPPERPLSDAELARRLAAEGIDISRRTVAKYRECRNIPSSHRRRRPA